MTARLSDRLLSVVEDYWVRRGHGATEEENFFSFLKFLLELKRSKVVCKHDQYAVNILWYGLQFAVQNLSLTMYFLYREFS